MTTRNNYLLKIHELFYQRTVDLTDEIIKLKQKLSFEELTQHPVFKLAYRVYNAALDIIPADPNHPDYRLEGNLRKYRRYKRGLERYRLFFGFSSQPKIILYLYLNDEKTLRKAGSKSDPYEQFKKFVNQGKVSHDPADPKIQKWISDYNWQLSVEE